MNQTLLAFMLVLSSVASAQNELDGYEHVSEGDSTIFFLSDSAMNWQNANESAISIGGHLATFSSVEEHDAIVEGLAGVQVFFGLVQDEMHPLYAEPDGGWVWCTGEPLLFTLWDHPSEPNNAAGGESVGHLGDNGLWNDQPSETVSLRALIEMPINIAGCTNLAACNYNPEANEDDGSCLIVDLGDDIETCEDSVTLDAGDGFGSYLWSTGETSQSIVVGESGAYGIEAFSSASKAALQFSNSNQIKRFSENPFASEKEAGSITTWIKLNDFNPAQDGDGSFFINGFNGDTDNIGFGMHTGVQDTENKWRFGFYNTSWEWATADSLIELDRWYHLTGTWGPEGLRIYVDGSLVGSSNNSGPSPSCSETVLGGNSNASLMCSILEVAMWEHALDSTEIQALLNCPLENGQDDSGLLGYWNFESHNGLDWLDLSPYQNHLINHAEDHLPQVNQTEFSYECEGACLASDEILVDFDDCDAYCGEGTVWDPFNQECIVAIPTDTDFDGCVAAGDLLNLLGTFGSCPPIPFSDPCQGQDHVTYQGHDYDIVAIGEQCWFAENLMAENYRNGDAIPSGFSDVVWSNSSVGAYAVYGASCSSCLDFTPEGVACGNEDIVSLFGLLYNQYAVLDSRGLCPSGWHVPSISEYTDLGNFLGGVNVAGAQMKKNQYWMDSESDNTIGNSSGFSALPVGVRHDTSAQCRDAGKATHIWTSDANRDVVIPRMATGLNLNWSNPKHGFAIRCIKDQ